MSGPRPAANPYAARRRRKPGPTAVFESDGTWLGNLVEEANKNRRYWSGLQEEHALQQLPEDTASAEIADEIADALEERGLQQLPHEVLAALITRVLDDKGYRVIRRNPPPLPPDPRSTPVTMHGDDSVTELESILTDNQEQVRLIEARGHHPGWIYYLRVGDKIKIGFSANVKRRLKSYPPESELLAVHPGTQELEKSLHKEFGHSLSDGREWFTPNLALTEHIDKVTAEFGPPPERFKPKYRKAQTAPARPKYWSGK